jgi:hypothetical protein
MISPFINIKRVSSEELHNVKKEGGNFGG